MISFSCTQCRESLEAPESMGGEILQCPKCKYPEKVPMSSDFGISLEVDDFSGGGISSETSASITSFGENQVFAHNKNYKRNLSTDSGTATRMRTFHARLSDNAMQYLDDQVNEWIDNNPEIFVKFSNITVGLVEGKKTESHLIISVWY